jgi:Bacterial Ig-like domain
MSARRVLLCTAAAALILPLSAAAQEPYSDSQYDRIYGTPVDVSITDLANNPESYQSRAIRTRGRLDLGMGGLRSFALRDPFGTAVGVLPVDEIRSRWEQDALSMTGQDVEVTGTVRLASGDGTEIGGAPGAVRAYIVFWSYQGPPEKPSGDALKNASAVSLGSLVGNPGSRDNQLVRVVGKFRGRNLYGDLPSRSQRRGGDWVIKDDAFAVWVSGKKPKGKGFDLDASLKRDTGKWIEVIGKPTTQGGVTYIQAVQISLSRPPTPTADALPPPPPPERPKVPPVIVFAMPVDGEGEVPTDSRFIVQFNKDMDETSFKDRVVLRYAGPVLPGDQPLTNVKVTYDRGRRALIVDPGMVLAGGRQLELVLLPGIVDTEGLSLTSRTSPSANATDILRFGTGT